MNGDAEEGGEALPAAPLSLDRGGGWPAGDGRYFGAISDCSTRAWDGSCGPWSPRRLQRKAWLYWGAFSERAMMGFALVDAGLFAIAFVYLYDRRRQVLVEEKLRLPFGFPARFSPRLDKPWTLEGRGGRWHVEPSAEGWRLSHDGPRLQLSAECHFEGAGLTAIASPPGRPFHHTYKACALPVRLRAVVEGVALEAKALGCLDYSLGYPPRRSQWNWASLCGHTPAGRRFGLNLVAHFMNGLENGLWLDGEIQPLGQALFHYDPAEPLRPWTLRTVDGRVDLLFQPEGERREHVRLGFFASRFTQPFGHFQGTVRAAGGPLRVEGYGVVEAHDALW